MTYKVYEKIVTFPLKYQLVKLSLKNIVWLQQNWKIQNMLHFMPLISEMCGYVEELEICLHEFIKFVQNSMDKFD
jgi:hypothetical protein